MQFWRFCALFVALCAALLTATGWVSADSMPLAAQAPQVAQLRTTAEGVPMAVYTGYLVDPTAQLTFNDIRTQDVASRFIYSKLPVAQSAGPQAWWYVIRLNQLEFSGEWVLSLPFVTVQDLQFYGPVSSTGRQMAEPVFTGSERPFSTRPLGSEQFAMRVPLELPGQYTVYVRAVHQTPHNIEFKLWDLASFYAVGQAKRVFDGICYGVIFGMLVYNLVLWLAFRDRIYALYLASGAMALLTIAGYNGHLMHYVLPDLPIFAGRLNVALPALWIASGSAFATSFLELRQLAPVLRRLILGNVAIALLMASLCAVGYVTLAQVVVEYSSLVGMLVVTAGAMVSWRTGFQPARLYLAGQTALFVAVLVTILHSWGVIDWPFIMENGLQSGVAIEVMVFALALSSRLRLMQATQAQLQRRADEAVRVSESDPLTGICNRAGLASKARDLLAMQRQRTLILIDLDKFKPINDIHGHAAGDAMLVEVARRLKEQLRTSDVVARVGGDEFVVLIVEPHDRAELEVICQRLLVAIGKPLLFHGTTLNVGSSMGLARYPKDGAELAGLLHAADVAMYHVKKNGRSGFAFLEDLSSKETLMAERGVAKTNATGCDVESQ